MPDHSLVFALYAIAPLGLTAIALWFLFCFVRDRAIAAHGMALLGAALILVGMIAPVLHGLLIAAFALEIGWLDDFTVLLSAPGCVLLVFSLWSATRQQIGPHPEIHLLNVPLSGASWILAFAIILLAFSATGLRYWMLEAGRNWQLPLVALAELGRLAIIALLFYAALRLRRLLVMLLFAAALIINLILQATATSHAYALVQDWGLLLLHTLGGFCFALGAYHLRNAADAADARARHEQLRRRALS